MGLIQIWVRLTSRSTRTPRRRRYAASARRRLASFVSRLEATSGTIFPMIDWSTCSAVERDPDRVSGAWVFRGSRVPVSALFQNLEDGAVASQFVDWFPGVTLEQVRAVLDHAARSAVATA